MDAEKPLDGPGQQVQEWFVLAGRAELDRRINTDGKVLMNLDELKDEGGSVLVQKYGKLTKPIWRVYRAMQGARELIFVTDRTMAVIDAVNTTFLVPDDIQRFGALYASWGKESIAEQFFAEALKSGSVDANINTGVYWYSRGEKGVMAGLVMAKKYFTKALEMPPEERRTAEEIALRKTVCRDAIDEIDYRAAPLIEKIIRFIIRLLTFHFETIIPYVGPAAAPELAEDRIKAATDCILARELELKKSAFLKLIRDLTGRLTPVDSMLQEELLEISADYGSPNSLDSLHVGIRRLGEFAVAHPELMDPEKPKADDAAETKAEPAVATTDPDLTAAEVCDKLATHEEIERAARKYKLVSLGEIEDLAGRPSASPAVIAWLIRDKQDEASVMDRLIVNAAVPNFAKKLIRKKGDSSNLLS